MSDTFRQPTAQEQEVIAAVARQKDRLLMDHYKPVNVVLAPKLWGTESDHWAHILGLPVIRGTTDTPEIALGVSA